MNLNFVLDVDGRRQFYENEIKKLENIIVTSDNLTEIYNAHQQKQEFLRLLNRGKGA